ncbi:hypothetical protein RYA05_03525 [Pseudomonas syringae pv. actinidiae]|nr:hypothetical protein [Pseudomonas syringae pv. actinidiae]
MCGLAEYLKIDLKGQNFLHLGRLQEAERLRLLATAHAEYADTLECWKQGDGWHPETTDRRIHPQGETLGKMDAHWWTIRTEMDTGYFQDFIPHPKQSPSLDAMFLVCDYTGEHDDDHLQEDKEAGIIAMLLEAPHGCQMLHSNNELVTITPGDVVLLNDLPQHGAYPLRPLPEKPTEGEQMGYQIANNMKFIILAKYHWDNDIAA